jgi:hypothetical protein
MPAPQNLKQHTRYDPPFHFVIIPLLLLNLIFSITIAIHDWPTSKALHLWGIVMALVFLMMADRGRAAALKAQNRIIRLEERLRLVALLPTADLGHIDELTTRQLIALASPPTQSFPILPTER